MSRRDPPDDRCPRCGGVLVRGLPLNQNAEVGAIGLQYRAAKIFVGTEPLLADLCTACGTVARLFVETTDRKWVTR